MGFRQQASDWFFKRFLWVIFVGLVIGISFVIMMVVGFVDIILFPLEFIISLILDKNVLMWFTIKSINAIDNPLFNNINEFEKKYIKNEN